MIVIDVFYFVTIYPRLSRLKNRKLMDDTKRRSIRLTIWVTIFHITEQNKIYPLRYTIVHMFIFIHSLDFFRE